MSLRGLLRDLLKGCAKVLPVFGWLLLCSFLGVLLVGVLVATTITTRDPGSILWSLWSRQRSDVRTTCSAWHNLTSCPAPGTVTGPGPPTGTGNVTHNANWTVLHGGIAGGYAALSSWEVTCIVTLSAMILLLNRLLFSRSWTWQSWCVSALLFLVRAGVAVLCWWRSDPLASDFMPLLAGVLLSMLLECLGRNALRPRADRVMQSWRQLALGTVALCMATFLPYGTWYTMGTLIYGGVSMNPYGAVVASTAFYGCVSVVQSLLFSHLPQFPVEACLLLRYALEVCLLFPRRQFIATLETNKEVVMASLVSSLGELGKGLAVSGYRSWRSRQLARKVRPLCPPPRGPLCTPVHLLRAPALRPLCRSPVCPTSTAVVYACAPPVQVHPADADWNSTIALVDTVSSILAEQVSIWAAFVGGLTMDPRLFATAGEPTAALTLGGACRAFLIQEAFEIVSDTAVLGAALLADGVNGRRLGTVRHAARSRWLWAGTAFTACGAMASLGYVLRWGCLSCHFRAQGYLCDVRCSPDAPR